MIERLFTRGDFVGLNAEQLALGGTFSDQSVRWVNDYMKTTVTPMTPEVFAKAMEKALLG